MYRTATFQLLQLFTTLPICWQTSSLVSWPSPVFHCWQCRKQGGPGT